MKILLFILCLFAGKAYSGNTYNIKFDKVDTIPVLVPYANYTSWVYSDVQDTSTNCATLGGHTFVYSQADTTVTNFVTDSLPYLSTIIKRRICSRCFYEEKQIYTFGTQLVNEPVNFINIRKKKKKKTGN